MVLEDMGLDVEEGYTVAFGCNPLLNVTIKLAENKSTGVFFFKQKTAYEISA